MTDEIKEDFDYRIRSLAIQINVLKNDIHQMNFYFSEQIDKANNRIDLFIKKES